MTTSSGQKIINASWFKATELQALFKALLVKGDEVKIVGGAPRNHLLGKEVEDIDLATIYTPQEVIEKAKKAKLKYIPTGIDHGTLTLIINKTPFEITSLRKDVKTDGRRAMVEFGKDWLQDAKRRDFTINALYVTHEGEIEDPLGQGLKDIKTKTVRFIGNAENRIKEDNLRSLRYYRFAAYYSQPPFDQTALSATIALRDGLKTLSAERVKSELFKILKAPNPKPVLKELYLNGLLTSLLGTAPNIKALFNLIDLEADLDMSSNTALRCAVLAAWHQGDADRLKQRLKLSKKEVEQIKIRAKADLEKSPIQKSICSSSPDAQFEINKYLHFEGKENYISLLKTHHALGNSHLNQTILVEKIKAVHSAPQIEFPLKGTDLIERGFKPGPELGVILDKLVAKWLKSNRQLQKDDLLAEVSELKN